MSQPNDLPSPYMALSTESNPLTAPLPKKTNQSPAERALQRFAITGNAIVTGGSGGIGLEAARALLEHGVQGLAIFARAPALDSSKVAAMQTLHDEFPSVKFMEEVVDVTNEEDVKEAVAKVARTLGSVDVLLCFAGIVESGSALNMPLEMWNRVLEVNLTGSFLCARVVAKQMISQRTPGSILFVSSVASRHIIFPLYQSAYAVSKAGVLHLTTALAAEWAQYGIRVNSISPGLIQTPMSSHEEAKPAIQSWLGRTPLGRCGNPDELSGAVVFLCSDAGRFVTGTDVQVDGGAHVF